MVSFLTTIRGDTRNFDKSLDPLWDNRGTYGRLHYIIKIRWRMAILAIATCHVRIVIEIFAFFRTITHTMTLATAIDTADKWRSAGILYSLVMAR
jgi:hypothetical protein